MGVRLGYNRSIEKIAEYFTTPVVIPDRVSKLLIRYPRDTVCVFVHRWRRCRSPKAAAADTQHAGWQKVLGATWQRCRVHFMRNALACVTRRNRPMVAAALRNAFDQPTREAAKAQWRKLIDAFDDPADRVARLMCIS
jgi:hypothetical protein